MTYILKHSSVNHYQINTTLSIEEYKSLLTKGEEVLAVYTVNGEFLGIKDPDFLGNCEIAPEQDNPCM